MIVRPALTLAAVGLLLLAGRAGQSPPSQPPVSGYHLPLVLTRDTLRPRIDSAAARHRRPRDGAEIEGYLSPRGLPPVPGNFVLTDSGLVFHSSDGALNRTFPLVGPVRQSGSRRWRASAVSLAQTGRTQDRAVYLFRVDGGVFETSAPGPLLELADHPVWLDSLESREWRVDAELANPRDSAGLRTITERISSGSYADTLYALFGRPAGGVGLVGERARSAGRLAEFIGSRDSVALDPTRMTSEAQLRHAFAHELGHRWQARARAQVELLWRGIEPIRDPRRYGFGNRSEHQAEAVAFAVHYLQTTAASVADESALILLDHYELLVPGTRVMVHYLALQPVYAGHPLRGLLNGRTGGQSERRTVGQSGGRAEILPN